MNENNPGDGGCQRGSIRYRLKARPRMLHVCHCSDCQKQSASAFGMSLIMAAGQVEFVRGDDRIRHWDTRGENGDTKRCYFCPDCGTRVMHGSDNPAEAVSIKAGSLDNTRDLRPGTHIWLQSAQPSIVVDREPFACFDTEPDQSGLLAGRAVEGEAHG